jgi:hypothetical protein
MYKSPLEQIYIYICVCVCVCVSVVFNYNDVITVQIEKGIEEPNLDNSL